MLSQKTYVHLRFERGFKIKQQGEGWHEQRTLVSNISQQPLSSQCIYLCQATGKNSYYSRVVMGQHIIMYTGMKWSGKDDKKISMTSDQQFIRNITTITLQARMP